MHSASCSVKDLNSFLLVETQTDMISSDPQNPTATFKMSNPNSIVFFKILEFLGPSLPGVTSFIYSIHSNSHPVPFPV